MTTSSSLFVSYQKIPHADNENRDMIFKVFVVMFRAAFYMLRSLPAPALEKKRNGIKSCELPFCLFERSQLDPKNLVALVLHFKY